MADKTTDNADTIRQQFGPNAANYATSRPHVKGASLERLVELIEPQSDWRMLDIATAAGHTAWTMAPHVAHVTATDLIPEMLNVAKGVAEERGIDNVTFELANAEALPFDDDSFDLVTCRIAAHHFPNPRDFMSESARVLRPGASFALVDNIVPADTEVAEFANHFEARRDPSHARCLSMEEWVDLAADAGLAVTASETVDKRMNFEGWAKNMDVAEDVRLELLNDLRRAPHGATAFLRPEIDPNGDQSACWFTLTEGILIAKAEGGSA